MSSVNSASNNIWSGLLPKTETQSAQFCENNPEWDGRGVIVGIMDTGVCPAAIGLEKTSNGLPKVIDIIDCTGSGDVIMSEWIKPSDDGYLTHDNLGSMKIKINPSWVNPTGQYRVACKSALEMYPRGLESRVKNGRQQQWDAMQKKCELAVQQDILKSANAPAEMMEDYKLRLSQLKTLGQSSSGNDASVGPIYPCVVFHTGEEYVACIDSSETNANANVNSGTSANASAGATDTDQMLQDEYVSDMSNIAAMREYHLAQEYRTFSSLDCLSYGIHIYAEGTILSIVTDAGAHASHVSGIVSAYHPSQPECNGVAPGAQIVSLKIGDSRLGSMETGVGLCRALLQAKRSGCHIVNMSYGEAVATENQGYFIKLLDELVHKHGVLFVTSAGNNGPCLSTVGAPGGTTDSVISVGAMVTQSLMKTAYPMIGVNKETNFTWSSAGPSVEGARGVCVVAPGGAVTSVPSWTLNRNQLMNGTSMSSPNCCGCIALLLSALRQSGMAYTPHSVRRAIEHSAKRMENMDTAGQGHGLIQVQAAWEVLLQTQKTSSMRPDGMVPYKVTVMSERFTRGIYLRQAYETSIKNTFKVDVSPMFTETFGVTAADNERMAFNQQQTVYEYRVRLVSSQPWITCPDRTLMVKAGKVLPITIDPRELERERVFSEYVRGYLDTDSSSCDNNSPADTTQPFLFEIPITVIRPKVIAANTSQLVLKNVSFSDSTHRHRRFMMPPPGCQFIDCIVTDTRKCYANVGKDNDSGHNVMSDNEDSVEGAMAESEHDSDETTTYVSDVSTSVTDDDGITRMMIIHALQLFSGTPYRDNEKQQYLQLRPGQTQIVTIPVTAAGVMLEICMGLFWSTIGAINCNITLQFRGVEVSPSTILIPAGCRVCPDKIRLFSNLAPELDITPAGKLEKWHSVVQPSNTAVVKPLLGDERNDLRDWSDSGILWYYMNLEYAFEHAEGSGNDVIPRFSGLQGILYESHFHSQFMKIYDVTNIAGKSGKTLVGVGDAFPDKVTLAPKCKYILCLQIRHHDASVLESLASMPLVLERTLKSPISLSCFNNQADAIAGSKHCNQSRGIVCGGSISYFIKEPSMDSLPKGVVAGELLTGSMTFMKKNDGRLGAQDRPKGYSVTYVCGPIKAPAATTAAAPATAPATTECDAPAVPISPAASVTSVATDPSDSSSKVTTESAATAAADTTADTGTVVAAASEETAVSELQKSLDAALKEAKFKLLKSMVGGKDAVFAEFYRQLSVEYPTELPPHVSALQHAESRAKEFYCYNYTTSASKTDALVRSAETLAAFDRVEECANKVISLVDTATLAGVLGVNTDKDNAKAVAAKKEADGKKATLVEALFARSIVMLNKAKFLEATTVDTLVSATIPTTASTEGTSMTAAASKQLSAADCYQLVEVTYHDELVKWEPVATSAKCWRLVVEKHKRAGRWGSALKRVCDVLGNGSGASSGNGGAGGGNYVDADSDTATLSHSTAVKPKKGGKAGAGGGNATGNSNKNNEELVEEKLFLLDKLGWMHILDFVRRCTLLNIHSTSAYHGMSVPVDSTLSNGSF